MRPVSDCIKTGRFIRIDDSKNIVPKDIGSDAAKAGPGRAANHMAYPGGSVATTSAGPDGGRTGAGDIMA